MAVERGNSHAQGTRRPKYRTSCDRCQAAKVKCDHEKPSCKRCMYHRVECVYGISRRMGRPRAKKSSGKDPSPSPQGSINGASDENNRSKSATPAPGSLTGADTTIEVGQVSAANGEGGRLSRPEPTQRGEPWTPSLTTNFEHQETGEEANDSVHGPIMQSMNTPLSFLPPENRMELDDFSDYPPMSSFMDDLSDPVMSQPISVSPSLGILDPQALISEGPSTGNTREPFGASDTRLSLSLPQPTQPWNSSQVHQLQTLFDSNPASKSKRRASTGQNIRGIVSPSSAIHSNGGYGNMRTGELQIATGPIISIAAGEQSAAMTIGSNPDACSLVARRRFLMEEEDDACCNCHIVITDCIVSLKAEQQRSSLIPMDCALRMESEIEASLSTVHQCKNCRFESSIHLLSLIGVRLVLDVLQKTVREEFITRPKHIKSGTAEMNSTDLLLIGSFKVSSKSRCRFLRKVVQARFCRLATLVDKGGKLIDCDTARDCYSKSGAFLLGDISQALRSAMGWVELWNLKH